MVERLLVLIGGACSARTSGDSDRMRRRLAVERVVTRLEVLYEVGRLVARLEVLCEVARLVARLEVLYDFEWDDWWLGKRCSMTSGRTTCGSTGGAL